jgi:two-component system, sensor histidine kinase and response regulator
MKTRLVLVVDDDMLTRKLAAERLERRGLVVMRAADGREALRMARAQPPDLVLLDLQMPVMGGFEVLCVMRTDPALAGTRIVAMTASLMPDDQGRMEQAPFDAVLSKPFRRHELLRVVGEQLGVDLDEPA